MSIDHLTGRATRAGRAQASQVQPAGGLVAATIATTPAGGERVDVLIGGDATQRTGPCVWSPVVIDGELFTPARDDPCFVTVARRGGSVVVWWEPRDGREGLPVGEEGPAGPAGATGATGPAASLETWRAVGAGGQPAFANSWVNYGGGQRDAAFAIDSMGFVHLRGSIKDGTIGATAWTLPTGYRPAVDEVLTSVAYNGALFVASFMVITAGGLVQPQIANTAQYLTGKSFSTT